MKLIRVLAVCLLVAMGAVGSPATSRANSAAPVPSVGGGAGGEILLVVVATTSCYLIAYPVVFAVVPFSSDEEPGLGQTLKEVSRACWFPNLKDVELRPPVAWECPPESNETSR
ncbi:MAG: hypothetical protein KDH09_06450, partial [Chrysiogenetes bacterium]|nr:hypothetical protein [Chrysiogenetes bacterium]